MVFATLILFSIALNRLMKSYMLFSMIPCLVMKFISFILMMINLDKTWGPCYITNA